MKKLEIGIIGLGKFGFTLGRTLAELGHYVVGLDSSEQRVKHAQDIFSQVYQGDATDVALLRQLRFHDFSAVAVSVGSSMEASILAAFNLQELGAKKIIVKAISPEHKKVLSRLGLHRVVQPEEDVAVTTAYKLVYPGMVDMLPLSGGILLQELTVDAWDGKSLRDLDITNSHGVMVVAVKQPHESTYRFVPKAMVPFVKGDKLLVIGERDVVLGLKA